MRAPEFWAEDGLLSRLLSPLAFLYALGGALRNRFTTPQKSSIPVICIGNLVAGGAGKTPVALDVISRLRSRGLCVHALTRGYGGTEKGPTKVALGRHSAADVGDEALLLAEKATTWVSADRPSGAKAAAADGADIIVMDDGFQNPSLEKDLSLVVIDSGFGLGNGRVMPAGPLREPAKRGLARADAVILLGNENAALQQKLTEEFDRPLLQAGLAPKASAENRAKQAVFAFAGIGRPEKFYATLRDLSLEVLETRDFPDHHPYTDSEIDELLERAAALNAIAITTEKDTVRLSPQYRSRIATLPIEISWQNSSDVDVLIGPFVKGSSVSG
ncbi:tetraacyldisaccharide 4'-kinase [Pelagibius sp. Alg239-R121]|uniref:tetraacyldisaccharide 4'-kinase n=1 Tax=Pelagibius sp. Alg239-R121 TaxID=2993448 RepID=UPI0024A60CC8|nr:tetraacyldisaccharide 4'-kinase [Pelagibius sp. Alg239-R121]